MGWFSKRKEPEGTMGLRNMWLTTRNLPSPTGPEGIALVLVDVAAPSGGHVTLMAACDGAASLYNQAGGGTIGYAVDGPVGTSARALVTAVARALPSFRNDSNPTTFPKDGTWSFHAVRATGVLRFDHATLKAPSPNDPASPLFEAAHELIFAMRMADAQAKPANVDVSPDGLVTVRDGNNPEPCWITARQLHEILGRYREHRTQVGLVRPSMPGPAAKAALAICDASGVTFTAGIPEKPVPDKGAGLHAIACTRRLELVEDLLARGADLEARDASGYTPLHIAANFGPAEMLEALIRSGAKVEAAGHDKNTAIMFAAQSKDPRKVKALLAAGANVNHRGQNGWTALDVARAVDPRNPALPVLEAAGGA